MPECKVRGQEKPEGDETRVYTARVLKEDRIRVTGNQISVMTTYCEFQEHRYFVCASCRTRRDKVVRNGLMALSIIAGVVLLIVSVRQDIDWMFLLAFFVPIAGIVVAMLVSVEARLGRKAREERGPGEQIKTFNEGAFKIMVEKQR